jgi:hypothetical protein
VSGRINVDRTNIFYMTKDSLDEAPQSLPLPSITIHARARQLPLARGAPPSSPYTSGHASLESGKRNTGIREAGITLCVLPSYPLRISDFQSFVNLSTSSHIQRCRQASSHHSIITYKSSTAVGPHSTVSPTTTSESSSDFRPRIMSQFLGPLFNVPRKPSIV